MSWLIRQNFKNRFASFDLEDLSQIENPLRPDRTQWIEQLAHTEWTIPEIESGIPLRRLLKS